MNVKHSALYWMNIPTSAIWRLFFLLTLFWFPNLFFLFLPVRYNRFAWFLLKFASYDSLVLLWKVVGAPDFASSSIHGPLSASLGQLYAYPTCGSQLHSAICIRHLVESDMCGPCGAFCAGLATIPTRAGDAHYYVFLWKCTASPLWAGVVLLPDQGPGYTRTSRLTGHSSRAPRIWTWFTKPC